MLDGRREERHAGPAALSPFVFPVLRIKLSCVRSCQLPSHQSERLQQQHAHVFCEHMIFHHWCQGKEKFSTVQLQCRILAILTMVTYHW